MVSLKEQIVEELKNVMFEVIKFDKDEMEKMTQDQLNDKIDLIIRRYSVRIIRLFKRHGYRKDQP